MRTTIALLIAALAACGDDSSTTAAGGETDTRGGEQTSGSPGSPDQVAVEDVLRAQQEAVRRNDGAGFAAAFTDDVFVFGPLAAHSLAGRDATIAAISRVFGMYLDASSTVTSQGATYGFTTDRRGAWVFDVVAVSSRGTQTTFHVTTVLSKEGADWKIAAQAWTTPVADDLAVPLAAQGQWPDPAAVAETVGDGAQPVREAVTAFLAGGPWPTGTRSDSLMIGTAPGEIRRGDAEIGPVISGARSAGVGFSLLGGVTTRVVAGGALAFAAYGAHLTVPHGGQQVRLPVRALDIYVRDGAALRLVVTHVSLGAPG